MSTPRPKERHPPWIICLAIVVCAASVFLALRAGLDDQYAAALGFIILAVVGSLLPRIRNFVLSFSVREQRGTAAVNVPTVAADSGSVMDPASDASAAIAEATGAIEDAKISQPLVQPNDESRPGNGRD
jgi:hypothetical protein